MTTTEIKTAVLAVCIACGDSERWYIADVSSHWNGQTKIDIEFVTRVTYDKEPDPQIQKDPVESTGFEVIVVDTAITLPDLVAKVKAAIEEIELKPIEHE